MGIWGNIGFLGNLRPTTLPKPGSPADKVGATLEQYLPMSTDRGALTLVAIAKEGVKRVAQKARRIRPSLNLTYDF